MNAKTKGIAWYLGITFGLAWTTWEVGIRAGVPVSSAQFQILALPGAFAPAIAAIVVRRWITREGFGDAGLGLHVRRWPYYLFAWLLPLGIVGAIIAESWGLGLARPDFTLARAIASPTMGPIAMSIASGHPVVPRLLTTALASAPILWGEEFGWRGYLQQRLYADRPIYAASATGAIWAVWHFPVTLRGYDYPDHPLWGSLVLIPVAILFSFIFAWILRRSGSIWACSLAHAATNGVGGMLMMLWFAGASGPTILSYGGVLAIPPLFIVCACIHYFDSRAADSVPSYSPLASGSGAPPAR
jgi:membrane protease YdiL (CAAX protease family)